MTSLDAAAALICSDGCLTDEEQSKALAKVPTDRDITKNWSIWRSVKPWYGVQTRLSNSSILRPSLSPVKVVYQHGIHVGLESLFHIFLDKTSHTYEFQYIITFHIIRNIQPHIIYTETHSSLHIVYI